MLIIANNPLSNERELHEFDYSLTIQQNIERHIKSGTGHALFINGEKIDCPEECAELDRVPCFADVVVLVKTQDGIDPGSWILFAISMAISAAAYFLMPKPEIPNGIGEVKNSPNSSLTGQTNIARVYQAIPDIYGQIVSYPDLIQEALDEYVDNVKRITQWMCIGIGKYTVDQVKYGKTPIADMPGGGYEIFSPDTGTGHYETRTTTIPDVYESFSFPEANGQEIVWQAALTPLEPESSNVSSITREYDNRFYITAPSSEFSNFRKIAETENNGGGWAKIEMRFYNSSGNYMFIKDEARLLSYAPDGGNYIYTIETKSGHDGLDPNYNVGFYFSAQTFGSYYDNPSIGPFISPVKCDQVWVNIAFPRGMKGTCGLSVFVELVDDNGDNPYPNLNGTGIGYKRHDYTISLDTYSEQYRTIKTDIGIIVPQGSFRYKVRIARTNPDNADSTTMAKLEAIKAISYYDQKTYKGVTLARFTINATEQATSGQENKFNALVTRHVRTIADETVASVSASRDATRAICHMFTVMAGESGSDIDYDALAAIQASMASNEALGYFDWSFDDKDLSLGERLKTAANAMRCAVFRDGVKWSFWRDQLSQIGPVMQFDYRNLAASGDSQIGYNGILPSSHDGVELEYADPTENKKAYIRLRINADRTVSVAQELSNALKIQLAGCRNYTQATNRAYLEAMKLIYQNEVVTDTALQDAAALNIGDVVRWIDPNDFETDDGMFAGEILAIDGFAYETSEAIEFGALTGRVMITGADGVPTGPYTCTKRTDGKNGFVVAQQIGNVYTADGYNIQSGSRYCVMVGVTDQQIQGAGLYVLTDKKPNVDGTVGITLVNYDPVIYTHDGD